MIFNKLKYYKKCKNKHINIFIEIIKININYKLNFYLEN